MSLRAIRKLAASLDASPDTAGAEDLRRLQMLLVDEGASPTTLNSTISGLKLFFDLTLDRRALTASMQPVPVARTLPAVLSREEVSRLLAAAWSLEYQTSVTSGAGSRASEVVSLEVDDVDSRRMTLRVEQGKGRKDRSSSPAAAPIKSPSRRPGAEQRLRHSPRLLPPRLMQHLPGRSEEARPPAREGRHHTSLNDC